MTDAPLQQALLVAVWADQGTAAPAPYVPDGTPQIRLVRMEPRGEVSTAPGGGPAPAGHVRMRDAELTAVPLEEALIGLPGPVVAAALDQVSALALWHATRDLEHVIAVNTLDAAQRVADLLGAGRSIESVLVEPDWAPRRLTSAPNALDPGDRVAVEVRTDRAETDDTWLSLEPGVVRVHARDRAESARWRIRDETPARQEIAPPSTRLLIGPANFAGQGREWARAVNAHLDGVVAENIYVHTDGARIVFQADVPLTVTEWQVPRTRALLARDYVLPASHILLEAARPLLAVDAPGSSGTISGVASARRDVDALLKLQKSVGLIFHGSEVRDPVLHAALDPWSPFRDPEHRSFTEVLADRTSAIRRAFFDDPQTTRLVSTLDLIDYVRDAVWLPIVVGPQGFAPAEPALHGDVPVVAHAPTSNVLKGSQWVDPVLDALDREGVIRYRRVQDIPPSSVAALLRDVDVLVDQVVLGNPGVLAAQAMAAGRLVLSHLPETVRRRFPEPIPVVEVNPATLEAVLREVASDQEAFAEVAIAGRAFARRFHDGRYAAAVLRESVLT